MNIQTYLSPHHHMDVTNGRSRVSRVMIESEIADDGYGEINRTRLAQRAFAAWREKLLTWMRKMPNAKCKDGYRTKCFHCSRAPPPSSRLEALYS